MTEKISVEYWCNVNVREKFFDGYKSTDDLVLVGALEVRDLNDAFEKFNRIDKPVPVLDEAEAPSMSVGDVVHVTPILDTWSTQDYPDGTWFAVARMGFDPISVPDRERQIIGMTVPEVLDNRY